MHTNDHIVPNKTLLATLSKKKAPSLLPIPPEFSQFIPIVDKYLCNDSTGNESQYAIWRWMIFTNHR